MRLSTIEYYGVRGLAFARPKLFLQHNPSNNGKVKDRLHPGLLFVGDAFNLGPVRKLFMHLFLNVLWLFFGGWTTAVSWFISGLLMILSIVGIPWARAAFNIALLNLWPFGSKVVDRESFAKKSDLGTGWLGLLGNIIWFFFCGWWLAIVHLVLACALAITIIGIPFALQHLKLAKISIAPIGKAIRF